jgi:hypothetical protein
MLIPWLVWLNNIILSLNTLQLMAT